MTRKNLYEKGFDIIVFVSVCIGFSILNMILFYNQSYGSNTYFNSDMPAYILHIQGLESGYDFPYPIYFLVAKFFYLLCGSPELGITLATTLFNLLTLVIVKIALTIFLEKEGIINNKSGYGYFITFISLALMFCQMFFSEWSRNYCIEEHYLGVFSGTPWHNGTYLAARPFMLLSFLWWLRIIGRYEDKDGFETKRDYYLFSLFLFLSTMTKPSFTLVFLLMAAVFISYRCIKSHFRNFIPSLYLCLCFIPTLCALIYQYLGVFMESGSANLDEKGIGIGWMVIWGKYTGNLLISIGLAIAYPIFIGLFHFFDKKNICFRCAVGIYIAGLITASCFYEKGIRSFHFNFSWGYMCGIFLLFFVSILEMCKDTGRFLRNEKMTMSCFFRRLPRVAVGIVVGIEWLLFLCHLYFGIVYFYDLFIGKNFF